MDGKAIPRVTTRVSVVVASVSNLELLTACVASLRPQCERFGAELIIARPIAGRTDELGEIATGCMLAAAPVDADLPRVRGAGLARAGGEWVILTEDHCVADERWIDSLMVVARPDMDVLGGPVGNAQRTSVTDCGAYYAEYGIYGGRTSRPKGPLLAAANVAYRNRVVPQVVAACDDGEWEDVIHDRLRAAGHRFLFVPTARVCQNKNHHLREFCRNRFQHGRTYAKVRARALSPWRRLALLAGAPLLPLLLAVRISRAVSQDDRQDFWRALPASLAFLGAWAFGEAVEYARGATAT